MACEENRDVQADPFSSLGVDGQGRAKFELDPGVYEVFASAPGFAPTAKVVPVYKQQQTGRVLKLAVLQGDPVEVEGDSKDRQM